MKKMRRLVWTAAMALIAIVASLVLSIPHPGSPPKADLFWMPYCPSGQVSVKKLLAVLDNEVLPSNIDFHYIANEHAIKAGPQSVRASSAAENSFGCQNSIPSTPDFDRFSSLHGRRETEESIRQVVILRKWPTAFMKYLKAFLDNPEAEWQDRTNQAGIPAVELDALVHSPIGANWFSENIRKVEEQKAFLSPMLFINDNVVPHFPSSTEDIRSLLCSARLLADSCEGILCSSHDSCLGKFGYVGHCEQGKCVYQIAPQRADAVTAYLIVADNCVPAADFPVSEALNGWTSYLNLIQLNLVDEQAQNLLKGSKVTSFPVLIVDGMISKRDWGGNCIQQLRLTPHGGHYLVSFDYLEAPFLSYAKIVQSNHGIRVLPNHFAGALLLHRMGNIEAATKSYRLALADNPEDFRAWNNLGAIFYDDHLMKKTGGAMFEKAVALNASYAPALNNLLRFALDQNDNQVVAATKERLGWVAIENRRWKEAVRLLTEISQIREWEFSANKGLAFVAVQERRLNDALKHLEQCLKLNPQPAGDFANLLAGVYFRLGDHAQALIWYNKAINDPETSEQAYSNFCYLLSSTERWNELLVASDRAFADGTGSLTFGFYKAQALAQLDRVDTAIELLKLLSTHSEEAGFRSAYELAMLYRSKEAKTTARRYADQFIRVIAAQRNPTLHDECMAIGHLSLELGEVRLATEAFQQALRSKPSDVSAHKMLASCYKTLNEPDRSQEHWILFRQFGGVSE